LAILPSNLPDAEALPVFTFNPVLYESMLHGNTNKIRAAVQAMRNASNGNNQILE